MRINLPDPHRRYSWHSWYAWHPIFLEPNQILLFERVERKKSTLAPSRWEYREDENTQSQNPNSPQRKRNAQS